MSACATSPAIGRGGNVYRVVIESVDGRRIGTGRGHPNYPACVIQVGDRVNQVWLADPKMQDQDFLSPVVMEADASALHDGVALDIGGWPWMTFHRISTEELEVGAAVVNVPGPYEPHSVELRFEPVAQIAGR